MRMPAAGTAWRVLEDAQPFSRSMLWDLQRSYFAERGVDAWRQGEVPEYISSNPVLADSYAEIVFGLLLDQNRLAAGAPSDAPLHICELGAGSGRFAFHFLTRLLQLCEQTGASTESFRYILTDRAETNLRFWREHPRFQPFFEKGLLDVAAFDIDGSNEIATQIGGATITTRSLARPLVVIANYVFDSVPQDLFYIDDGKCQQCLVSLAVDVEPGALDAAGLLERVQYRYDLRPLTASAYEESWLEDLLAGYRRALADTYLLVPAAALRCLHRLRALSTQGLALLSADKGHHRLMSLQGRPRPKLARHGSFSLSVNYHAIKSYCERSGGLAMFPSAYHRSLNVGLCLMVGAAEGHLETRRAYVRHVQDFSPDDFYTIVRHGYPAIERMSVREILAHLRLSHYDGRQLGRSLPRLMTLAPTMSRDEYRAVSDAVDRVWERYFPLGEEFDLPNGIAGLLCEMDDYRRALEYFGRSIEIYGEDAGTLANMAACRRLLAEIHSER